MEHYSESEQESEIADENFSLGNIGKIFTGIKEHKNILVGVYNDEYIENEAELIKVDLFEPAAVNLNVINEVDAKEFFDIVEESDFVCAVKNIISDAPQNFYVQLNNCVGGKDLIETNLKILNKNFSAQTKIFEVRAEEFKFGFEHRDDYTQILKKYWGHDTFRNFKVYDLAKLAKSVKSTVEVSQEQIISDIVQQVEHCENDIGRDIFVTAPTGSGKSAIFQVPAIYLAEKYNLLTIVISPLIGLMNDQVKNLETNYPHVATIHSDIAPPIKDEIISDVAAGKYHILYISPETLLSRNDVEDLIGNRSIGMVVIDEAHIVTTWGKQFRPDYWYLGNHVRKLRKSQLENKARSFVIATFTATAIYGGVEDMYNETIDSLHMLEPITYLGYMKRGDINIEIDRNKSAGERAEFGVPKYTDIARAVDRAEIFNKKTLIYFPTVRLIEDTLTALASRGKDKNVAFYHGKLGKDEKIANYEDFLSGKKLVMLATKAFGMGIDIDDIEIVMHFAPTGNVCDYVQEIGRAARRKGLNGAAIYHYDKHDFKYINRLQGLSAIKKYQLIAVVQKIVDLYQLNRKSNLLLDAENFTYIFNDYGDENSTINKVKTALLMIQRDFELKFGFSPVSVRPIPLFAEGFFEVSDYIQRKIRDKYGVNCLEEIEKNLKICRVNLKKIWRQDYQNMTFPQFKYLLYSNSDDLDFNKKCPLHPAFCVTIDFASDFENKFKTLWNPFKNFIKDSILIGKYLSIDDMIKNLKENCVVKNYRAQNVCEIIMAAMSACMRLRSKNMHPMFTSKTFADGQVKYFFNVSVKSFLGRTEQLVRKIVTNTHANKFYLSNVSANVAKEYSNVLGILETMGALSFDMVGGANSQIFIHINQIGNLKNILNNIGRYNNRIIDAVAERHKKSVEILTNIYEGDYKSADIWNLLEDYFLGRV